MNTGDASEEANMVLYNNFKIVLKAQLEMFDALPTWDEYGAFRSSETNDDFSGLEFEETEFGQGKDHIDDIFSSKAEITTGDVEMGNTQSNPSNSEVEELSGKKLLRRQEIYRFSTLLQSRLMKGSDLKSALLIVARLLGWDAQITRDPLYVKNAVYVPSQVDAYGRYKCTVKGCSEKHRSQAALKKHIVTHFGKYLFCPACGARYNGNMSMTLHFNSCDGMCIERLEFLGFIDRDGAIKPKMKLYCNLYYLGLLDAKAMAKEHFEMVAQRRA